MVVTWVKDAIKLGWDPFDPGGAGAVTSVNGQVGDVVLTMDDILDGVLYARPTVDEVDALVGTVGIPGAANPYVTNDDARMTNARPPTAHGHPAGDISYASATPYPPTVLDVAAALDWIGQNIGTTVAYSKVVLGKYPVEAPDGVRTVFTLPFGHKVDDGLMLFLNGQAYDPGTYVVDIVTARFFTIFGSGRIPKLKDSFIISYTRQMP